jgi:hypothetical protein
MACWQPADLPRAADHVRAGDQPQDRQGARPRSAPDAARPHRRGDRVTCNRAHRLLRLLTTGPGTSATSQDRRSKSASLIGHSGSSAFRLSATTVSMSLTGSCFFFSNRAFRVKRFQTIRHYSVDVAHGLVLLFGIGSRGPSIMGFEDEAEQSFGRPCRQTNGRSKRTCELTSSIVPRGTSFHRSVELECPSIGFDPERFSCCCRGLFPGPAELGCREGEGNDIVHQLARMKPRRTGRQSVATRRKYHGNDFPRTRNSADIWCPVRGCLVQQKMGEKREQGADSSYLR